MAIQINNETTTMVGRVSRTTSKYVTIDVKINDDDSIFVTESIENFTFLEEWLKDYFSSHTDLINKKTFDLGFSRLGNGVTVYNRMKEEHGDYQTVAHIDDNNPLKPIIKYYESADHKMKSEIEDFAKPKYVAYENLKAIEQRVSTTQGTLYIFINDDLLTSYAIEKERKKDEKESVMRTLYAVQLKLIASELLLKSILNNPTLRDELIEMNYKLTSIKQIFNLPHPEFTYVNKVVSENWKPLFSTKLKFD